jgi:hypothetical protein
VILLVPRPWCDFGDRPTHHGRDGTLVLLRLGTCASTAPMGLDVSLFGYAAQDYILISINALFLPLVRLLVASVG